VTGLYNLEFFVGFLQQQLLFSSRQKLPVGVTLIGIDNFAEINERMGPQSGDMILNTVARKISITIRSSDLLARYSGDQFALVLPNTDIAGSRILAEKLRAEVEAITWEALGKEKLKVTVSVGCAVFKEDDVNPETILRDAKMALQNAKNSGRNCVAV
jgi:diguanylate cyclase (GGDEF)-like protein